MGAAVVRGARAADECGHARPLRLLSPDDPYLANRLRPHPRGHVIGVENADDTGSQLDDVAMLIGHAAPAFNDDEDLIVIGVRRCAHAVLPDTNLEAGVADDLADAGRLRGM